MTSRGALVVHCFMGRLPLWASPPEAAAADPCGAMGRGEFGVVLATAAAGQRQYALVATASGSTGWVASALLVEA